MANRVIRGRSFAGRRSPGRLTEWLPSANITIFTQLGGGTFILDQTLTTAEKAKLPFTVTRTVGTIWVASDQFAAPELPFGAMGMMVVSDKASATGATAVPDPITEEGSDEWFTYQSFLGYADAANGAPYTGYHFDSRAQRRVVDGEDIAVVVANARAGQDLRYVLKFRLLVKLS